MDKISEDVATVSEGVEQPPVPPVAGSSNRKRKVEVEEKPTPVLRRSLRLRNAMKEESSIFETPPPSTKKPRKSRVPVIKSVSSQITRTVSNTPPQTLMSIPYELQDYLFRYLDVEALEALSATCSHFDLMIKGRYLTSLSLPLDTVFLQELKATDTLEKKPLLRLECKKPRQDKEEDFMLKFVDSQRSLREYIIHSQMALLSLNKVREIDLLADDFRTEDLKNSSGMLECYQAFDKIILRQMLKLGNLKNISRLDIMILKEDFSQSVLKEFMPSFENLLEVNITIGERKNCLRSYYYGILEDIVTAVKAPLLKLTVVGVIRKNFPKVFENSHIEKLVVSAPCNFSISLLMKNLREVGLEMAAPDSNGDCCSFNKSKLDDRKIHRTGLCIIHMGSLYSNCPKIEIFDGINLGKNSQENLNFRQWNTKLRKLFYEDYVKKGGTKEFKGWKSSRWFSKMPTVTGVYGKNRYPSHLM